MGVFEDYINELEGKENLDPLEVARKMHELHTEEIGTNHAKIEELASSVAERDAEIAKRDDEIKTWKAKNFDLANQIPGTSNAQNDDDSGDRSAITIDDLFQKG